MENILDKIIANKKREIANQKKQYTIDDLLKKIEKRGKTNSGLFKKSLQTSPTGIIAEFKRRSPSKDWLFEKARIENIVPAYSKSGASAISVLTDFDFFGGTLFDLSLASGLTNIPLLRKDFMVDEYQFYQAAANGASAILLIASALSVEDTKQFAAKAKDLGLDVLLEIHNEAELSYINEYVDVVGINNRDLTSFITDIQISFDLADKIPSEFVKISESGISSPQAVLDLREAGYRGFLMGETFMKTDDPGKALSDFIKELNP